MPNRRPANFIADKCARSLSSPVCLALALAGAVAASTLTGCGLGTADSTTSPLVAPAISGQLFGGVTPIVGATVKMYATGNSSGVSSGYGVATLLQEATQQGTSLHQDTSSTGGFSFAGGYNCPAGQFAYMVATGGNSGGNSTNNNLVLVAAMGRCEDLYNLVGSNYTGYKGTPVYINELSTIAAAYSLGHFATVTGTGASTVVSIGAPATNNAAQVSGVSTGCVAGTGSCTTTAAAGLAHAFQNAANLVNVFTNSGIGSNANATVPGNSSAVVPRELINTIGNVLISCVNSNGGVANDGTTACGSIFGATTIGTSIPNNTFSAMVNLAANPTLGGSLTNVDALFNLATPSSSVYQPALSATSGLNDYTIAINYPGFTYPYSGALDINDDYFVGNSGGSATAPVSVSSFSSNGTNLGATGTNGNLKNAFGISVDALGNGYLGNGSSSGINALGTFTFSGGVPSATLTSVSINTAANIQLLKVYATAVDKANNLWAFGATNSGSFANTLYMCPAGVTATSNNCVGEAGSTGAATSTGALLAVDPNQNVWSAFTQALAVLPNTGTVAAPTYPATVPAANTATVGPNIAIGLAFTGSASQPAAYLSGYKATTGPTPGVQTIGYTQSGVGVATITPGANQFGGTASSSTTITGAYGDAADGAGQIWVASFNDRSIFQTTPGATTPTAYKISPCIGGVTPCATIFGTAGKPTTVAVDSTGSVWATSPAGGNVVEIIGSAAPTWPLLSLGKVGTP